MNRENHNENNVRVSLCACVCLCLSFSLSVHIYTEQRWQVITLYFVQTWMHNSHRLMLLFTLSEVISCMIFCIEFGKISSKVTRCLSHESPPFKWALAESLFCFLQTVTRRILNEDEDHSISLFLDINVWLGEIGKAIPFSGSKSETLQSECSSI